MEAVARVVVEMEAVMDGTVRSIAHAKNFARREVVRSLPLSDKFRPSHCSTDA